MIEIRARKHYDEKYRAGFPLLLESFVTLSEWAYEEGELFTLLDHQSHFLAKGYFGKQNKGIGWLLTWKEHEEIDDAFFMSKLIVALNRRVKYYQSDETTAFRVFNGEGDGIGGLTIDYYEEYYVFTWYSEGIYAFRNRIIEIFTNLVAYEGIYEKRRFGAGGKYADGQDFVMGVPAGESRVVLESDVSVVVRLDDGPMVGVFLDQREVRKALRDRYAAGKTVLNTFSYTGVFSVFATLGGAKHTVSVDLASRSAPLTEEQMEFNGIEPDTQTILVQDVFDYFDEAVRTGEKFDIVILDPPSMARSKRGTFTVASNYGDLVGKALELTEKDGMIIASTNHSGLQRDRFLEMILEAFKEKGVKPRVVEEFRLPGDFMVHPMLRESDYLKVFFVKREDD